MPVCALFREPVGRLSRKLVCSTGLLTASDRTSINFLAQIVCPWWPFEKYRARAAYQKSDAILTKIDTQLSLPKTHLHTKFQPSSFIRSPVSADQSFFPARAEALGGKGIGSSEGAMPVCLLI